MNKKEVIYMAENKNTEFVLTEEVINECLKLI